MNMFWVDDHAALCFRPVSTCFIVQSCDQMQESGSRNIACMMKNEKLKNAWP